MARPQDATVTLADIVNAHVDELGPVTPQQGRALAAIAACRTSILGGHRYICDSCGHTVSTYNSCRNRHCPQCQGLSQTKWVQRRQGDLLPVEYFHAVFTIPTELHDLFLHNQGIAYGLLFAAASETLAEFAASPKHLGATIGTMGVLHTWTQTLNYHPHVHFIVPGGGPALDGARWISCRPGFLFPVRALSVMFRGKLLASLEAELAGGRIHVPPMLNARRALKRAARKKWVVYSKPSFLGPAHVIKYLGRYTHRIAISNHRLVSNENGVVTFRYKDRRANNAARTMSLPAAQFLRRFLLHVLPRGFVRIRYFGGLAHTHRVAWLDQARRLLAASGVSLVDTAKQEPEAETWQELYLQLTGRDPGRCPRCPAGRLILVEDTQPYRAPKQPALREAPS